MLFHDSKNFFLQLVPHTQAKDRTEYTAHEQYVADQLASGQYGFFPVNHALSLEGRRDTGVGYLILLIYLFFIQKNNEHHPLPC